MGTFNLGTWSIFVILDLKLSEVSFRKAWVNSRTSPPGGGGGALFKLLSGGVPLTLWNPDPV